jgi:hypothetical protein
MKTSKVRLNKTDVSDLTSEYSLALGIFVPWFLVTEVHEGLPTSAM